VNFGECEFCSLEIVENSVHFHFLFPAISFVSVSKFLRFHPRLFPISSILFPISYNFLHFCFQFPTISFIFVSNFRHFHSFLFPISYNFIHFLSNFLKFHLHVRFTCRFRICANGASCKFRICKSCNSYEHFHLHDLLFL
jgi:hypothetical protein